MEEKRRDGLKKEKLVKQREDREMAFEFGKIKVISNCCKSSFVGGGGKDISLFEVSQSEEVKSAKN